ncbi:hypothetical protein RRSWK_05146 [Rhodopirellula sp. SWK7]|nr:hypothetical protein RRSWK_05146 [Rhodopirellula sp. SWK7]
MSIAASPTIPIIEPLIEILIGLAAWRRIIIIVIIKSESGFNKLEGTEQYHASGSPQSTSNGFVNRAYAIREPCGSVDWFGRSSIWGGV